MTNHRITISEVAEKLEIDYSALGSLLHKLGYEINVNPHTQITQEQYEELQGALTPSEKVLELDSDAEYEGDGLKNLDNYELDKDHIEVRDERFSVFELIRNIKRGRVELNPSFQRNLVWSTAKKCEFIESIIMDFPLPLFFLNETTDGKWVVIDGRQRITTLKEFFEGSFKLSGLKALDDLNGQDFKTLEERYQIRLEDKQLIFYIVKPSTPIRIVYEIFKRINTGGTQLNRQEVRNCILTGNATKLLGELADCDEFQEAIDNGVSDRRMKAQEMILRFLAFKMQPLDDYAGNMSNFLESAMRKINKADKRELNELRTIFMSTMVGSYRLFGKRNFRYPTPKTRGSINMALFETVSMYISNQTPKYIEDNIDRIRDNFGELLNHPEYREATQQSTGDKAKVRARFRLVHEVLGK